jgi:hypothetical protein
LSLFVTFAVLLSGMGSPLLRGQFVTFALLTSVGFST